LELLVAQGALSFEQFTGIRPPLAAMREAVGLPWTTPPPPTSVP
jgi:shikimate 5-dehydrogenase